MADPRSDYLKFLPPVWRQSAAGGPDPAFLERFLLIFETILGRAPVPTDPDASPSDTTPAPPRDGLAVLIDALPGLFYPQLEPLFPGDETFLPPIDATAGSGTPEASAMDQTAAVLGRLDALVGASEPGDADWQIAVTTWLSTLLRWQSDWVGQDCPATWSVDQRRAALAGALPGFRAQGTAQAMVAALNAHLPKQGVQVTNLAPATPLIPGQTARLPEPAGPDAPVLGGGRPFAFLVEVMVSTWDLTAAPVREAVAAVTRIVEAEKPALTRPVIRAVPYPFRLGDSSVVGRSTLLPLTSSNEGATP